MGTPVLAEALWGKNARFIYLLLAAVCLLFIMLGGREMWTQEHRWAQIVASMFFYQDYLHPILNGTEYYDKPLLSYWMIAALSVLNGQLTLWTLRLPSAMAGVLAIWSIYRIGLNLKDKSLGLLAGWLLLTTYYFVFWARIGSTDMLNLAGSLFAVAWYFDKRNHTRLFDYIIFFLILAVTALCKGLVGPVVAILAILPDFFLQNNWKRHLNLRMCLAIIPAIVVYILPFWASQHYSIETYEQNGLYEVYRENVMRYFRPFDHKGPIYTYLISLPLYLFPWIFFFVPTLFYLKPRWNTLSVHSKWAIWATLLLFLFFTLSGSRRNYYILPLVPYALLMTADWILSGPGLALRRNLWAGRVALGSFLICLFIFNILQPWYYLKGGLTTFNVTLKTATDKIKLPSEWKFSLLDAESKVSFYLNLPPDLKNQNIQTNRRENQTRDSLIKDWPVLSHRPGDTIILSRKLHIPLLRSILKNYTLVEAEPTYAELFFKTTDPNSPVAFVPNK